MTRDATTAFARTLVDEWARHGVTDACLAPGSRSAPLALALAADDRIRLHVHLDERSASFFALGLARATGRPAVLLCTSGTAARELPPRGARSAPRAGPDDRVHRRPPARAARHRRGPDHRPGEALRRRGPLVPRGRVCPATATVPAPTWRALASRAVADAAGSPAGPVHLNLPFREPLVPTGERARRRARAFRRPPVDRARCPACGRRRSRCSTRSRTSSPTAPAGWSWPAGVPACARRRCCASPRPPAGRCSPTRSRACGCRARSPPTTRCCASRGFADGHRARRRAPRRRAHHQQGRDAVARPDGRPGARRSRRRVARSARTR